MMVWLWGINLWIFSLSNINYAKVFDLDQNHMSYKEIWKVSNFWLMHLRSHLRHIILILVSFNDVVVLILVPLFLFMCLCVLWGLGEGRLYLCGFQYKTCALLYYLNIYKGRFVLI